MYKNKMNLTQVLSGQIPVQFAAKQYPNSYGIEVELEGKNICSPPEAVQNYWDQHKDGSLRIRAPGDQAIEYVSNCPYNFEDTAKSVRLLFDYLTSGNVKVYESYRTSIHVHVNFATEEFRTIYNFMCLSLILDELLVSQNGEHRIGNNFCLRARDALGQVQSLIHSIETGHNFFGISANERYSSINFASLLKFGSIEFRSLECTTHEGRLMHWIGTLAHIKERAKTYTNPVEIIQQFSIMSPKQFLQSVLGPYAMKYINVPGAETMLFNGMRIAQDFAFCSEWNEAAKPKKGAEE